MNSKTTGRTLSKLQSGGGSAPEYNDAKIGAYLSLIGIISLLLLHAAVAFMAVPQEVVLIGNEKGISTNLTVAGYSAGIFIIYSFPALAVVFVVSLFNKNRRNTAFILRLIFWSLLVTLVLSIWLNIFFVPDAVRMSAFSQG